MLFALKKPPWPDTGTGDSRFWGAQGEVRDFLARLYDAAFLPARLPRRMATQLGSSRSIENLYLFLPSAEALETVYATYRDQYAFFTALESAHLSRLLAEVRTRVRMTPEAGGGEITYRELSEGEQQLLLVLGLLKFTARDEALFLLDEPDTHLNPAWSTQYLDFLSHFIRGRRSCHIVMATHDALVFSSLTRAQVRIVTRGEGGDAVIDAPLNDPRGMGIQAILASDLFRLPSGGLDPPTVRDLDRQRRLAHREGDLTPDEEKELRTLTSRLRREGFWKSDRDPLYQLFREKFLPLWLDEREGGDAAPTELTVEQSRRREATAARLAERVAADLRSEHLDA